MSTSALNVAIEGLFDTGWADATPVMYDNVPFNIPSTSWVKLEVWDGLSKKATMGTSAQLRRTYGTVFITIYTPINSGSKIARDYADSISAIFRDVQVSGITFEEPDISRLGETYYAATGGVSSGTAQWYQMKVAIPFHYDFYI